MIRRAAAGALAAGVSIASVVFLRTAARRASDRLLDAPRHAPGEDALAPALDALGGEIVRIRSRDGLGLAGRWLLAEPPEREGPTDHETPTESARPPQRGALDPWQPDPREAILLLHGWSGSVAPDLVALGPSLRQTAGVLGLDLRGHGGSDHSPTTFGLREVEDVAGALTWLGQRGIERVGIVGRSMGGITAIAAVAVLGDGRLAGHDADLEAPAHLAPPIRPRIVAVVADSVPSRLSVPIAERLKGPFRRQLAEAILAAAARRLRGDMRETEPARVIGLLEGVPLLLISGAADTTVRPDDARRLVALAPPGTEHWIVPGAEHGRAHAIDPARYEARVAANLRAGFAEARESGPIIAAPTSAAGGVDGRDAYLEV